MEIKELENNLNDFIVSIGGYNNIIFNQLDFFYPLSYHIAKTLHKYFKDYDGNIKSSEISKVTLFEKLNFINDFYKRVGIPFDTDKYLNDGTINFEDYNYFYDNEDIESEKSFNFTKGYNMFINGKTNVNVCNNGFITDIPIFIHEISHFRSQPDSGRTQVGDLLTESLAITDEFICCDYLQEKGYVNEANIIIKDHFNYLYYVSGKMYSIYKMLLLFDKIGSVSKESYKFYYGNDYGYEYNLKMLKSFDYNNYFIQYTRYVLATALTPYLYCKYKEDNLFMKTLISLHNSINNEDIMTCFKEMGLTNFNFNEIKEMFECIDKIMFDINKVKTL